MSLSRWMFVLRNWQLSWLQHLPKAFIWNFLLRCPVSRCLGNSERLIVVLQKPQFTDLCGPFSMCSWRLAESCVLKLQFINLQSIMGRASVKIFSANSLFLFSFYHDRGIHLLKGQGQRPRSQQGHEICENPYLLTWNDFQRHTLTRF